MPKKRTIIPAKDRAGYDPVNEPNPQPNMRYAELPKDNKGKVIVGTPEYRKYYSYIETAAPVKEEGPVKDTPIAEPPSIEHQEPEKEIETIEYKPRRGNIKGRRYGKDSRLMGWDEGYSWMNTSGEKDKFLQFAKDYTKATGKPYNKEAQYEMSQYGKRYEKYPRFPYQENKIKKIIYGDKYNSESDKNGVLDSWDISEQYGNLMLARYLINERPDSPGMDHKYTQEDINKYEPELSVLKRMLVDYKRHYQDKVSHTPKYNQATGEYRFLSGDTLKMPSTLTPEQRSILHNKEREEIKRIKPTKSIDRILLEMLNSPYVKNEEKYSFGVKI